MWERRIRSDGLRGFAHYALIMLCYDYFAETCFDDTIGLPWLDVDVGTESRYLLTKFRIERLASHSFHSVLAFCSSARVTLKRALNAVVSSASTMASRSASTTVIVSLFRSCTGY